VIGSLVACSNKAYVDIVEGAMHTFCTPVMSCEVMGDYKYEYGHGVEELGTGVSSKFKENVLMSRSVALSASIQPDFELPKVMLAVVKLDAKEVIGEDLSGGVKDSGLIWEPPSAKNKEDPKTRAKYDASLRTHMVYHLTASHRLPARKDIDDPMSVDQAIRFLETLIRKEENIEQQVVNKFMETLNDSVVSLELLYNTAVQQVINEFSALEALFPQGYVYTYDPAVIFAREIGSSILNRLFLAAVRSVSNNNHLKHMRTFAFNDFADKGLVRLLNVALGTQDSYGGTKIRRCAKSELFKGKGGLYGGEEPGAMLVIHNNSDGFGQNIETEGMGGSLDGAIGASSSAAASLERNRPDLLDFIF
jgi:hypothetical protein